MKQKKFSLKSDYIELIKLLKLLSIASSGSHAKLMVEEGTVMINGVVEFRKRAKLKTGDIIEIQDWQIEITK